MGFIDALKGAMNPVESFVKGAKELITVWKLPPEQAKQMEMDLLKLQLEAQQKEREFELKQTEQFNTYVSELRGQIKVELSSEDAFVRRMRPTWGYATLSLIMYNYGIRPDLFNKTPIEFPDLFWYVVLGINGLYWILRSIADKQGSNKISGRLLD